MFHDNIYKVTSVEMCTLMQPRADIRDLEFKVRLPRLMIHPIQTPPSPLIDKPVPINLDRFLNVHKAYKPKAKIDTTNYVVSKTMTDYRGTMKIPLHQNKDMWTPEGTIADVTGTPKGVTSIFEGTIPLPIVPVLPVPHSHHIIDGPFSLSGDSYTDMYGYNRELANSELFGLNEVKIDFGKDMVGLFMSGNINDFRILHIPEVIPHDQSIPSNIFGVVPIPT
jgi:hypothetical protein